MKRKILIALVQCRCSVHELRVLENLLSLKLLFPLIASIVIFLFTMPAARAQYPVEPPEVKPTYAWTEWTGFSLLSRCPESLFVLLLAGLRQAERTREMGATKEPWLLH